jgi:hypothetical protein
MTKPSGMTLAIGAVAVFLAAALVGPYVPSPFAVYKFFQGPAALSGEVFVTMKSGDVKRGADVEIGLVRAELEFMEAWTALLKESTQSIQGATDMINLAERLEPVRQRARQLIGPNLVRTVRANAEGRYRFVDIRPGTYMIIAQHQVFDNHLRWSRIVHLESGENSFNLTNSNSGGTLP